MIDLFVTEDYTRDINPLKNYIDLTSFYLSRTKNVDIKLAREFVSNKVKNKKYPLIKFLEQQPNGDRVIVKQPLDEYYADVINKNRLMAGTGTVYKQPNEEESLFTKYINEGRANRKVFKTRMLVAKQNKDTVLSNFNNELQNDEKISNNTLSGATTTVSTPIYMATAHPSLASTGRLATSYANALNENLLRGNRHYDSAPVTLDALTVLAYTTDVPSMTNAVNEYGIAIPSVDDIMKMVLNSTKHYWRDNEKMRLCRAFVETCTPIERCNIYYNGSLYALSELNPELTYQFLDDLSEPATTPISVEESAELIKNSYSDLQILAFYLCFKHTKGKQLHELATTDPYIYGLVGATLKQLNQRLDRYGILIDALLKVRVLPANIYGIKSMYRKAVVTSDTDSTNFTCQELCKFVTGAYGVTEKDRKITFLLTYISSMMVMQALGMMSKNMGVGREYLRELSMKNEYYIPIHCLTTAAKNYIMVQGGQEGNILPVLEIITKGVGLRSSKIPKTILTYFDRYKEKVLLSLEQSVKLKVTDILTLPTTLEHIVDESLKRLETTWIMSETIKHPSGYARGDEESKIKNHNFYEAVFAPKYGHIVDIPYEGYQVDVDLRNRTLVAKWVDSIKDDAVRKRAEQYIKDEHILKISRFSLPEDIFANGSIPVEIESAMSRELMVMKVMSPWYAFLETFGIFLRNKHNSKMLIKNFPDFINMGIFETNDEDLSTKLRSTYIEISEDED